MPSFRITFFRRGLTDCLILGLSDDLRPERNRRVPCERLSTNPAIGGPNFPQDLCYWQPGRTCHTYLHVLSPPCPLLQVPTMAVEKVFIRNNTGVLRYAPVPPEVCKPRARARAFVRACGQRGLAKGRALCVCGGEVTNAW